MPRLSLQKSRSSFSGKIRILHLINPRGVGGAERVLLTLASNIDREKFDVVIGVFTSRVKSTDAFLNEVKKQNIELKRIKYNNPYDLNQIIDLFKIVKNYQPHVVHAHGYKTNLLGFLIAKLFDIPIVTTVHGLYSKRNRKRFIFRLSLLSLRYFDRIIVVSDQIRAQMKGLKVPLSKTITLRNSAPLESTDDLPEANAFRKEICIPAESRLVGFVGRLEPVKGCSYFINAISQMSVTNSDIRFVIVGDGSEQASLKQSVAALGLEKQVYFCGFRDDPINVFQSLDLYVLPSLNEGIPIALLEAMAIGVPVIATHVGGIPEVIQDRVNGILVPHGNATALAEAIVRSFDNPREMAKRAHMAKKTIMHEYNPRSWTDKIQNIYGEIVNNI